MHTQYLAEFKSRTKIVTAAGGNPGQHTAAVKLTGTEKGFEVDSLATEESTEKTEEVEKESA